MKLSITFKSNNANFNCQIESDIYSYPILHVIIAVLFSLLLVFLH